MGGALWMLPLLLLFMCSFTSVAHGDLSFSKRRYCDDGLPFPPAEDQSFVDMLDKLLEKSRSSLSGVEVSARDSDGRFEGTAGCMWHNCQIYDGECYRCHSTRDAAACIETAIGEVKESLHGRGMWEGGYCVRTREFATGPRSVAVNDASSSFQVCGIRYKFLGSSGFGTRSAY